jgi:hypothetical protein
VITKKTSNTSKRLNARLFISFPGNAFMVSTLNFLVGRGCCLFFIFSFLARDRACGSRFPFEVFVFLLLIIQQAELALRAPVIPVSRFGFSFFFLYIIKELPRGRSALKSKSTESPT